MHFTRTAAAAAILAGSASAALAVDWDEAINGDLSDDRFNPTALTLDLGSNNIVSTTGQSNSPDGDRDYFSVTTNPGEEISMIILTALSTTGFDEVAFIGLEAGPQISVDPLAPDPSPLLGFLLTDSGQVGTDLLLPLSNQTDPLSGTFSFWIQQTGDEFTTISLDIVVVPAPGAAASLAVLGGLATMRRRR